MSEPGRPDDTAEQIAAVDSQQAVRAPLDDDAVRLKIELLRKRGGEIVGYVLKQPNGRFVQVAIGQPVKHATPRVQHQAEPHGPATTGLWRLTDHLCRICLGRILERMDGAETGMFRCSVCAATHAGAIEDLCGCGIRRKPGEDMGFRCAPNTDKSKFPHEIIMVRTPIGETAPPGQPALPIRPER